MVKCAVPSCKSGYASCRERVSIHRFPQEPSLRDRWYRAVPRQDWVITNSSGICEKHFHPSDYRLERTDKNNSRKESRGSLAKKHLKKDAVPSIWPKCPSELSKSGRKPREENKHSTTNRREIEFELFPEAADKISSLADLFGKLQEDSRLLPERVVCSQLDDKVVLYCLGLTARGQVHVTFGLTINSDLSFVMSVQNVQVRHSSIEHVMESDSFKTFSEVLNVIAFLESIDVEPEDCACRWRLEKLEKLKDDSMTEVIEII